MHAMNKIPDELFNLIESKAWPELLPTEKEMVLNFCTQEEYSNIHQIYKATIDINQADQQIMLPPSIKENLDKKFKTQHQKTIMIPLWQAAAVIVMMLSGFVYYSFNKTGIEKTIVNTIHDTLFVPQYVETNAKLTDTIFIYRNQEQTKKVHPGNSTINESFAVNTSQNPKELPVSQIRTLSVEEIKSSIKNLKSKSMEEDTLYRKIGYASI